jgi:hypothetical protein
VNAGGGNGSIDPSRIRLCSPAVRACLYYSFEGFKKENSPDSMVTDFLKIDTVYIKINTFQIKINTVYLKFY